jgi:hypothetical protein
MIQIKAAAARMGALSARPRREIRIRQTSQIGIGEA